MVYQGNPGEFSPVSESAYCGAGVVHTMLLHSVPAVPLPAEIPTTNTYAHTPVLRIFPGTPSAWADVTFHQLRAEGGLLVSAVRKGGMTQFVRVLSEQGGPVLLTGACNISNMLSSRQLSIVCWIVMLDDVCRMFAAGSRWREGLGRNGPTKDYPSDNIARCPSRRWRRGSMAGAAEKGRACDSLPIDHGQAAAVGDQPCRRKHFRVQLVWVPTADAAAALAKRRIFKAQRYLVYQPRRLIVLNPICGTPNPGDASPNTGGSLRPCGGGVEHGAPGKPAHVQKTKPRSDWVEALRAASEAAQSTAAVVDAATAATHAAAACARTAVATTPPPPGTRAPLPPQQGASPAAGAERVLFPLCGARGNQTASY
jgi:hypothetical protein